MCGFGIWYVFQASLRVTQIKKYILHVISSMKKFLINISNNTVSWRSSLKPHLTECLILGLRQMHTKTILVYKKSEKFFLFLIDFVKCKVFFIIKFEGFFLEVETLYFLFRYNWHKCYFSFRCMTCLFNTCIYFKMITKVSLVNICH